jgi:hypothetical protein
MSDPFSFCFGKLPAKQDARNFKMAALLIAPPEPPESYDFDATYQGIPTPMFANDKYGDCVIAGRAHQTIRFEVIEQGRILPITDDDVVTEWRSENGNTDNGLYILDSIKKWRSDGWKVAGSQYFIKAFAQIDLKNLKEVRTTIASDIGIMTGFALPDSAMQTFLDGKPWIDTSDTRNFENGHCVYICAYDATGPTCITWGKRQKMSWEFFGKYCDEAYGVIDAHNVRNVNTGMLEVLLKAVTAQIGI